MDDEENQPPRDASVCETARKLDDVPVAQVVENASPLEAKASVARKLKRKRGRPRKMVLVMVPADQIPRNIPGDASADSAPRKKPNRLTWEV